MTSRLLKSRWSLKAQQHVESLRSTHLIQLPASASQQIPGGVSSGVTAVETILNVAALVNGFSDLGDTHSDYIQGLIGERLYSGTGSQASGEFEKSLYEN